MKAKFVKSVLVLAILGLSNQLVAAEPKQVTPEQTFTVNFKDTDLLEVVKVIAEYTGKTIIVDPKVRGPIKVISNKPLNKKELYELFLAVLDVHGFTAVESDGVVRIVANRDARNLPIPTENTVTSKDDGYITQIIQLNNISAAKVLAALRPLVPQYGHLSAYEPSNALIISDTRGNIARINELIAQMDKAAVIATDVLQLHYALATDVVNMITQLEKPDPNRGVTTSPPVIVADKRINAVIVSGDEMSRQRIKGLVDDLDKPQSNSSNVKVIYLKFAKAADVAKVLTAMLQSQAKSGDAAAAGGQSNVQADEATNSVLITAEGDSLQKLMAVVNSLDIRRAQVLIEAIIVEVDQDGKKDFGVQWMYTDTKNGFGGFSDSKKGGLGDFGGAALALKSDSEATRDAGLTSLAGAVAGNQGNVFGIGRLGTQTNVLGLLKMLQSKSGTNILSTPNLLTTDNTKAKISVGKKVPFATGSFSGVGGSGTGGVSSGSSFSSPFNTFNREDVGLTLEVTPHINDSNIIAMDIKQEVSDVTDVSGPGGPITNQRKIDTQILAVDGEVVVLGGLIKDDIQTGRTSVPVLGSIPLIGRLFRTQTSVKTKTNLMVFIRASIMRDETALIGATAEKYTSLRDEQLRLREREKEVANPKDSPVLPEWKVNAAVVPAKEGAPESTTVAPAPAVNVAPAPVQAPAPAAGGE